MDDPGFQERIRRDMEAREIARRILGVDENALAQELKRAWRRECIKHHPDRRRGAPGAAEKFKLVQQAYLCLSQGEGCEGLISGTEPGYPPSPGGKYNTMNGWGYFLSWRDRFF